LRAKLAQGMTQDQIVSEYTAQWGTAALAVPTSRLIWAVPLVALVGGAVGLGLTLRRWRRPQPVEETEEAPSKTATPARDAYDARLDDELKDLDG
jgi:cytochrome c-type biogenesis protein CcmH/NrfF